MTPPRSKAYTVAFTALLCGLAGAVLTAAHEAWQARIDANRQRARTQAIVEVLGLGSPESHADPAAVFAEYITPGRLGNRRVYTARRNGEVIGLAVEITAAGREGPIRGILGLAPDRRTLRGVRFYEQSESPDYGGRISQPEFYEQFAGKRIARPGNVPGLTFLRQGATGPHEVNAISGATVTSLAVQHALRDAAADILAAETLVPLELTYPRPVRFATPTPPPGSSASPPPRQPHATPQVPAGTKMLSRGAAVSADEPAPLLGEWTQITDGEVAAQPGSVVEFGPGPAWVQIDLGEPCRIALIRVWHDYARPHVYKDVVVRLAADADFTRNVTTLFNNDRDNSLGLGAGTDTEYFETFFGRLIDAGNARGRYLRLDSAGRYADDMNHLVEVEVFGRAVQP